jgi:Pretoxin HINT domain
MNGIAKNTIRGGARTFEQVFLALKNAGSFLGEVIEAAARCNVCISRTETALRGLKKTLSLKSEAALEWIANTARKFSDGTKEFVDDFMYKVLKSCVGSNSSARAVAQCEQLANWRVAGQPQGTIKSILNCGNSFTAATRVLTRTGLVAIASLSLGTDVLAFNETNNQQGYYPVTAVLKNVDSELTNLTLEMNGNLETVNTTPEHPFYLEQAVTPTSRPAPIGHAGLTENLHLRVLVSDTVRASISCEIRSSYETRSPHLIQHHPSPLHNPLPTPQLPNPDRRFPQRHWQSAP